MKKGLLILVGIALLVTSCAAYAVSVDQATITLYGGNNFITCPIVPFASDPRDFDNSIILPWMNEEDGLFASDALNGIDVTSQSTISFPNDWDNFPNFLMGDGYIAFCANSQFAEQHSFTYDGVNISDTDAWISLPGMTGGQGGQHFIGIPYPVGTQVLFYDVIVTNGSESHTLGELLDTGSNWLELTFQGMDAPSQSTVPVPDNADFLEGGQMYIVNTMVPNLALILPAPNPAL